MSAPLKLLHNSKKQYITNLYQWDACGRGFSDAIVLLSITVLVVEVEDCRPVFRLPFDFSSRI